MTAKLSSWSRRWLSAPRAQYVTCVFWGAWGTFLITQGDTWFGAAFIWLSGSSFTLAAWLLNERMSRDA